nr:MAG TPA: hypothetical protein [Caudoviricetes sp.]
MLKFVSSLLRLTVFVIILNKLFNSTLCFLKHC